MTVRRFQGFSKNILRKKMITTLIRNWPRILPGNRLQFVKELGLHHGDLVNDEVSTAGPVLQDPGPLSQRDTLLQRSRARADTWEKTQLNNRWTVEGKAADTRGDHANPTLPLGVKPMTSC